MENNTLKENCLEVLSSKEIIKTKQTNLLPAIMQDTNSLLPVIIKNTDIAIIEIKKEYSNLKQHKSAISILKFIKVVLKIIAKSLKFCFKACTGVIGFIAVATLIVTSTAIITKNIVNSYYGIQPEHDTTYSIFQVKD